MALLNNIAFDLDSVLVDIMVPFAIYLDKMYPGTVVVPSDSFKIKTDPEISNSKLWKVFEVAFKDILSTPIYPGVPDLLGQLYDLTNDPIRIVTARPHRFATDTYALVDSFMTVPYILVIAGQGEDKVQYLNGIDYYVEDRRKNVISLARAGKNVFMVDRPWNQDMSDLPEIDKPRVKRIRSVTDIRSYPFTYAKEI